jgi:hypothetical protein
LRRADRGSANLVAGTAADSANNGTGTGGGTGGGTGVGALRIIGMTSRFISTGQQAGLYTMRIN